jgi:hypothetical protein
MKKITLLLLALSFSICSLAQITIKGTVNNDSIPLESASVTIKNSKKGTATNIKGQFQLKAQKGDTLSISYLGYETKEIVVNQNEIFKIKLEEGGSLNEVVVNAFLDGTKISCSATSCKTTCSGCSLKASSVMVVTTITKEENKLFPNPSSNGIFQLKFTENYNDVKILISNIYGQIIKNSNYKKVEEKLMLDLSEVAIGIYIINIIADGRRLEVFKAIRS